MKNESKKNYPLTPGSVEFKNMYPHPIRTACLYIGVGILALGLAKYNVIPLEIGYVIGMICGFLSLPHSIAAIRSM